MYTKFCPNCNNTFSFTDNMFQNNTSGNKITVCPSCKKHSLIDTNPLLIPSLKFLTKLKGLKIKEVLIENDGTPIIEVELELNENWPHIPHTLVALQSILPSPWIIKEYFLNANFTKDFFESVAHNEKQLVASQYLPSSDFLPIIPNCYSNRLNNKVTFHISAIPQVLDKTTCVIENEASEIFSANCLNVYRSYNTLLSYILEIVKNNKNEHQINKINFNQIDQTRILILLNEYLEMTRIWTEYKDKIIKDSNDSIDFFVLSDFKAIVGDIDLNDFDVDNSQLFKKLFDFKRDYTELHKNYNVLSSLNVLASCVANLYICNTKIQNAKERNPETEFITICDIVGDCDYCPFLGQLLSKENLENLKERENYEERDTDLYSPSVCSNPLNPNIRWEEFFEN